MNKFQKTEVIAAALTLTVFAAGTVFAAPPGPPPTPNTPSATFNSVNVSNPAGTAIDATSSTIAIQGTSAGGNAVFGTSTTGVGVQGTSTSSSGVQGSSNSGNAVYGTAWTTGNGISGFSTSGYGVYGVGNTANRAGVYGTSTNANGVLGVSTNDNGVEGVTSSATGAGVSGASASGYGVMGVGNASGKAGVYGSSINGSGVYGSSSAGTGITATSGAAFPSAGLQALSTNANGPAVYAINNAAAGTGMGVYGYSLNNDGVFGYSNAKNGIWGRSNDATGVYSGVYGYSGASTGVTGYTNSGTAGKFQNSGNGNIVNLGTPTAALAVNGATTLTGATTITGTTTLNGAGGSNIDLSVKGRIKSGDASNFGGIWVNNAATQFFGQFDASNMGIWNNGWWFRVSNTGAIDNPSGDITLNDTTDLRGNVVNSNNFWGFDWPVIIADGFSVNGDTSLANTTVNGLFTQTGSSTSWENSLTVSTSSYGGAAVQASNSNTGSGFGVRGSGTTGVSGSGSVAGVSGNGNGTGTGVVGTAPGIGSGKGGSFFNGLYTVDLATPSYAVYSAGPAYKTSGGNTWAIPSDKRLKKDIEDYSRGLADILKLRPVSFKYKDNEKLGLSSKETNYGFVAQEVMTVIPEAISTDKNGYYKFSADPVLWAMVNAVKELTSNLGENSIKIENLSKENKALEERVAKLETKLAEIEAKL